MSYHVAINKEPFPCYVYKDETLDGEYILISVAGRLWNMDFLERGWKLERGTISIPPNLDKWKAYKFIQEAIYDGHIPVTKVIGYYPSTSGASRSARASRVLERDQNCAEDRFSIAANLSKVLIIGYDYKAIHTESVTGVMTVDNAGWNSSKKAVTVLSPEQYILRALKDVSLDMVVKTNTGYVSADENYESIMKSRARVSKTRYFPIHSYHNIIDFVKVLPFNGQDIRLRYSFGMNDAYMIILLNKLFESGDSDWLDGYKEVLA